MGFYAQAEHPNPPPVYFFSFCVACQDFRTVFDIEAQLAGFSVGVSVGSGSESSCCAVVTGVSGVASCSVASLLAPDGDVTVGLSVVGGEFW